jgi:hypothetical protein
MDGPAPQWIARTCGAAWWRNAEGVLADHDGRPLLAPQGTVHFVVPGGARAYVAGPDGKASAAKTQPTARPTRPSVRPHARTHAPSPAPPRPPAPLTTRTAPAREGTIRGAGVPLAGTTPACRGSPPTKRDAGRDAGALHPHQRARGGADAQGNGGFPDRTPTRSDSP